MYDDSSELKDNPYWLVTVLSSHLKHSNASVAEQHNLTPSQMQAMLFLQPNTPIPMNQLSCRLGCDASYITGIVDKLLLLQYIHRQEYIHDRRIKTIELTKKGIIFRKKLIKSFSEFAKTDPLVKDIDPLCTKALSQLVRDVENRLPKKQRPFEP